MFWKSQDMFIDQVYNGFHTSLDSIHFFVMASTFLVCFGQLGRSDLRHVTCAADLPAPANITSDSNLDIAVFDPRKRRYKAANGPKQGIIGRVFNSGPGLYPSSELTQSKTCNIFTNFFTHFSPSSGNILIFCKKNLETILFFNQNKNMNFQNPILVNLLFKTNTLFLKMIIFTQTQVQILQKYDLIIMILILNKDHMYLDEFFARN